jgi:hypothetical protein
LYLPRGRYAGAADPGITSQVVQSALTDGRVGLIRGHSFDHYLNPRYQQNPLRGSFREVVEISGKTPLKTAA